MGKTLTAPDNSSNMFADKTQSQRHVGQYNLQPVLAELPTAIPIELTIPTTGNEPVHLSVSPSVVQEWKTVVTSGAYGVVTHPIYSSVILLAIAYSFWQWSLTHAIGAVVLLLFFDIKARKEEAWLNHKFPEYDAY